MLTDILHFNYFPCNPEDWIAVSAPPTPLLCQREWRVWEWSDLLPSQEPIPWGMCLGNAAAGGKSTATEMLHQPLASYGSWKSQASSYIAMFKLEALNLQVVLWSQAEAQFGQLFFLNLWKIIIHNWCLMLTEFTASCLMKFKASKHFLGSLRGLLPSYYAKLLWFEPIRLVQNTLKNLGFTVKKWNRSDIACNLFAQMHLQGETAFTPAASPQAMDDQFY